MEEKKLKKVESPEQLDQYIKLTNPGIGIILIATILFVIGILIWGIFGKIETKIDVVVISNNNYSYVYVKEENITEIEKGMDVIVSNSDDICKIERIENSPEKVTEEMDEYVRHIGNFKIGEWVYKCKLNKPVKEGIYSANVTIESISPMSFITN